MDLKTLPTMIAIPLSEIESETHPIVQLWRISDTAELILRLIVAIAAAELEAVEGKLTDAVAAKLLSQINRPTLGDWLEMAEYLTSVLDKTLGKKTIIPELSDSVQQVLKPLLKSRPGSGDKKIGNEPSLSALRNLLAHGAGFGTAIAQRMLPTQRSRLLDAIEKLGWLREIRLVSRREDGNIAVLSGVRPTIDMSGTIPVSGFIGSTGEVFLVRGALVLPLWPLHAYLPPELFRPRYDKTGTVSESVPLVYNRRTGNHLQMTPLGSDFPDAELRGLASSRFEKLFRVSDTAKLLGSRISNFEAESDDEAKSFVGRADTIKSIRDTINDVEQGVVWLHGLAGSGKSALMAKMSLYYKTSRKMGAHIISYRFPAGDQRSTRDKFLRHAISRLESILDPNKLELRDDRDRLERRLAELISLIKPPMRIVVLLDGLDEIGRIDPEFLELPFRFRHEGLVWLCAGRPEPTLEQIFSAERCTRLLLGDGLRGLTDSEAYEWLVNEAPLKIRDATVRLVGASGEIPEWIVQVTRRAGGLANYIHLVLEDLKAAILSVGEKTPNGLIEYFDELLLRAGVDDPAAALPVLMAAISLAVEAPDAKTLTEVLRRAFHLREETSDKHLEIVDEALSRSRAMLRRVTVEEGEVDRYLPYHDSFTEHLLSIPRLANARAQAASGWRSLSLGVNEVAPVTKRHMLATRVRQLIRLGDDAKAVLMYADIDYHRQTLKQAGGKGYLLDDLQIIHALFAYRRDDLFEKYLAFLERACRPANWRTSISDAKERREYAAAFLVKRTGIVRRMGSLSEAQGQLKACRIAIGAEIEELSSRALRDLSQVQYELGYVQFLLGDIVGAQQLLEQSMQYGLLAGDVVGHWISRCVCASFQSQFGLITFDVLTEVLQRASAVFSAERWNPIAERWTMNVLALQFDAAFWLGSVEKAKSTLSEFLAHEWVAKFGGKEFTSPYRARLHLLEGNFSDAISLFNSYLYDEQKHERQNQRTEGLARIYMEYGRALSEIGDRTAAKKVWEKGISLPEDCGNHVWKDRIIRLQVAAPA